MRKIKQKPLVTSVGRAKRIRKPQRAKIVTVNELCNERFMLKHTGSSSLAEYLAKGGFSSDRVEELQGPDRDALDLYISRHTSFAGWNELLEEALGDYLDQILD